MADQTHTARDLARRSQAAVRAKDRDGWLSLFAPDAVVQDPIGPSPFDPDGAGHRGPAAIAAFYDTVIAPNDLITFEIESSYLCGGRLGRLLADKQRSCGGRGQAPGLASMSSALSNSQYARSAASCPAPLRR